jgi:hypothetical protein
MYPVVFFDALRVNGRSTLRRAPSADAAADALQDSPAERLAETRRTG